MSTSSTDNPSFQNGTYKIGGASSSTTKNGDNITSQYTAAPGEQQSYDYLESALPNLYKNATSSGNFNNYATNWANDQKNQLNQDYSTDLNKLKSAFVTSGQMKDSGSIDQLKPISQSYLNSMSKVNAQAPMYASQLRSADQTYNTNALNNASNGLNSYYNLGNAMNGASQKLSSYGNDWSQQQWQNNMQNKMYNNQLMQSYLGGSGSGGGGSDAAMMMML